MLRMLKRGASGAFLVQVGGAGLGLLTHLFLARWMGASEYGAYTLALTWISVLAVLAIAGQNSAVVRFIPRYIHHEDWAALRGLRVRTRQIVFISSALLGVVVAIFVGTLQARIGGGLTKTLWVACLLLPVLTQLQLSGGTHQGLKHASSAGLFNSVLRPVLLLITALCVHAAMGQSLTAPTTMLVSVLATSMALVASEWKLYRVWPSPRPLVAPRMETRLWLQMGRRLFLLAALGVANNRIDVLILGAMVDAAHVGPYYAAVQLASVAAYGLNAVNMILAPMISERHAAGDHRGLAGLVHRAAWLTFGVTAVVSLAAAVFGHWLLSLFGTGFVVAYAPLLIILVGQCFNAATGPVGYLLTMTNYQKQAAVFFAIGASLNALSSVMLVPRFGLIGAALGTTFSTIAWNVLALAFVRRKLGVNPTIFPL